VTANKKENAEQEFFIRISNPNTLRRELLEASKLILSILKQTYIVKQLREAKHYQMTKIDTEVKEIKLLVQKLDELVPHYTRADLKKLLPDMSSFKRPDPMQPKLPDAKPAPQSPQHVSELDQISRAIEEVSRKLQSL
jgi:hypothetical protein